ncbi:hypothetical protein D3C81_1411350 [compost metagenome]
MNRLQARRVGRIDAQLVFGTGHAHRIDLAVPRDRQPGDNQRQHAVKQHLASARDVCAVLPPMIQFAYHRHGDKPGQFDHEQDDPQQFEEEQVDRQGDPQKQHQPVQPGHDRERHQQSALSGRERFRPVFLQPQQIAPQGDPCQGRRTLVQVGKVQQVGEDEVAVETHERAGIERQ